MEMLGFKIVDVELVKETKADELTRQFKEVCPNSTHSSTVQCELLCKYSNIYKQGALEWVTSNLFTVQSS